MRSRGNVFQNLYILVKNKIRMFVFVFKFIGLYFLSSRYIQSNQTFQNNMQLRFVLSLISLKICGKISKFLCYNTGTGGDSTINYNL